MIDTKLITEEYINSLSENERIELLYSLKKAVLLSQIKKYEMEHKLITKALDKVQNGEPMPDYVKQI